jgi:hypothetical protein
MTSSKIGDVKSLIATIFLLVRISESQLEFSVE